MKFTVNTPDQLAKILRAQRKIKNLTQIEAAQNVGLRAKTISTLENNPAKTTVGSFFKLLSALELNIEIKSKNNLNNLKTPSEW